MRCTMLKEKYSWEPVCFDVEDILLLLENAVIAELVICRDKQYYWIGVACEYDRAKQLFGEQIFYIDAQEFASIEAFKAHAAMDGHLLSSITDPLEVIDTLEGNPAEYHKLAAELKKKSRKAFDILS